MKKLFIFSLGASVGGIVTWYFLNKKYERIIEEELVSIRNTFENRKKRVDNEPVSNSAGDDEKDKIFDGIEKTIALKKKNKIIKENGYVNYSDYAQSKETKEEDDIVIHKKEPYVISTTDFITNDDYEKTTLIYYTDGILADENDVQVDDPEELLGEGFENNFQDLIEDEDESLFIRNEALQTDYEVIIEPVSYLDMLAENEHPI